MRSQTLLAQKPKRVGRLANVGAKVRNINETVKLFGNFLSFYNFFAWFEGCLSTVHLVKWEVSHGTISPAKATYLRESSGTGSLHTCPHDPKHPTSVKNHLHFRTFIPKYLHNPNKCLTFAAPEPPSLLTMLKSGVVLFLYHYEIIV